MSDVRTQQQDRFSEVAQATPMRSLLSTDGRKGPLSGAHWPEHEIGDLLGEGGMASVYLAQQRGTGNLVALKILPARLVEDEDFRRRFEREASIARTMDSPHVVKVYSTGRFGSLCYLEMELVQGKSFSDLCKLRRDGGNGPYTSREVTGFAIQIARGLAEAGSHQVVHRDIKPGNIMQTVDGTIKIADFGIVKVLGEEALTMTGTAMGTPSYMSPEQGRGGEVDQRADLYSLGVVLYEMLTLRQPFDGTTADALIYQHHFSEPKPLWEVNPEADPGLQAVIYTCLQKFAERRYPDAQTLLGDLQLVWEGSAPESATVSKGKLLTGAAQALAKQGGWWRRYLKVIVATVLVLVFAVAFCVYWLLSNNQESNHLRNALLDLNGAKPIPAGAEGDLKRLTRLVGKRDVDVKRWQAKLAHVRQLEQQIKGFESIHGFNDMQDAIRDVRDYQVECGPSAPLVLGLNKRLTTIDNDEAAAKLQLRDLDTSNDVTLAIHNRLGLLLDAYARYRSPHDPEVARWRARLNAGAKRIADLRQLLSSVDAPLLPNTVQQDRATADLARLVALVGPADEQVIHVGERLHAAHEQVVNLRRTLSQLDGGELVSLVQRDGLKKEWAEYVRLVPADDTFLLRWQARIAQSEERRAKLSDELSVLDGQGPPLVWSRLNALKEDLEHYQALVGDDEKGRHWQTQVDDALLAIATSKEMVSSLLKKDLLTVEEQSLLHHKRDELKMVHALDQAQDVLINARLAHDEAHLKVLKEQLTVLDRPTDVPEGLRALLDQYERLAGAEDAKVQVWRRKLDEVTALRRHLAALDEVRSVPDKADEQVQRLIDLVGESSVDASRWADKLQQVNDLKSSLNWLDQASPIQDGAAERLKKLTDKVGTNDGDVQHWSNKLKRCAVLSASLVGLDNDYILPDGVAAACEELAKLTGEDNPLITASRARILVLQGPPRPDWAKHFGRDEHGLYADLAIGRLEQRFRFVPSGSFVMGSPSDEAGRFDNENQFKVRLTHSFWIADCECPQDIWTLLMHNNPSYLPGEHKPVERVSWNDVQHFMVKLAAVTPQPLNCRMPTEAEYEYACRAGTTGPFSASLGHQRNDDLDSIAVYARNSGKTSQDVRSRLPNTLGLFDMEGNVWEWCMDAYDAYTPADKVDPICFHGSENVIRGGSWTDEAAMLRSACRRHLRADLQSAYVGMRIVIDVDAQKR